MAAASQDQPPERKKVEARTDVQLGAVADVIGCVAVDWRIRSSRTLPRHEHQAGKIGPPGGKKLAGRAAYAQRTRR